MKKALNLALVLAIFVIRNGYGNVPSSLEAGFKNPPMEAKPRAYWCWVEGNFDKDQLDYELKEAFNKGMGGFDIWNVGAVVDEKHVVPNGPTFMGDASVEAIAHTINEATKYGMSLGLVLSSGWNSGGSWTTPAHQTMGLYTSSASVEGGRSVVVNLPFPKWGDAGSIIPTDKNGKPLFFQDVKLLAYPMTNDSVIKSTSSVIELLDKINSENNITITLPKGKWRVVRYLCLNTGQAMILSSKSAVGPMIDHLSDEAAEAQIHFFAQKLQKQLGTFKDKALKYFYNDSYEVSGLLWTPTFLAEFMRRIGYDMTPYLPVLNGFKLASKDTLDRFLFDYRKVLSDLIIENHYIKSRKVCESYGLGYVAEAAGPGKPFHNCPFESLRSSGVLSHPRGEFWYNHNQLRSENEINQLQIVKGVASASHIYNQKIAEAEAFTSTSLWQEAPVDLKPTLDRAFCEGLNRVLFHVFSHSPKSGGAPGYVYAFGTQINTKRTWWNMSESFMSYISRTSFMLQQGNFVGDVLYYYGDDAPNFVPIRKQIPSLGFGYDYDYINTDVLVNQLTVKDGLLFLPNGQTYKILVLPDSDVVNLDVLRKLQTLVSNGAVIIGKKPLRSQGLYDFESKNQKIQQIASSMWQSVDGAVKNFTHYGSGKIYAKASERNVLAQQSILPDFTPTDTAFCSKLDYIHRKTDDADIYFVRNTSDKAIRCDVKFRVAGKVPELWNSLNGSVDQCPIFENESQTTKLPLNLEGNGSVFVVFRRKTTQNHIAQLSIHGQQNSSLDNSNKDSQRNVRVMNNRIYTNVKGRYTATFSDGSKRVLDVKKVLPEIEISKNWNVVFPLQSGAKTEKYQTLTSWTDSENSDVKYFSGTAIYSNEFVLPIQFNTNKSKVILSLGDVYKIARVYINGQNAGVCWSTPFEIEISRYVHSGKNELNIEVANLEPNGMIADAKRVAEERKFHSNVVRLPNAWAFPMESLPNQDYSLLTSGLLGPVKVQILNVVEL